MPKIAIIGGGVAGVTSALSLGDLGLDITLFEREKSLVNGPPFCHLHAGGNLYPDISDTQCITLLKQSIDFLRFYPHVVDYRPTVIALPTHCSNTVNTLLPRLKLLAKAYATLIDQDSTNEVLGKCEEYYKLYTRKKLESLAKEKTVANPKNSDEWMIPVAKSIDFDQVQFPLILVQEYGLNLFRLGASAGLALEASSQVTLKYETSVVDIKRQDKGWDVGYDNGTTLVYEKFDYLINAAGFRTGKIDDMLGVECKRMVEFKAAYVSHWKSGKETMYPEIIFHGERGTPRGMGQFTPYPQGYFQLHGMTHEITLYEEGLVSNTEQSCQPQLGEAFIAKIEENWKEEETIERTQNAISHLATFIPSFSTATVGSKPLFGAQQIPGDDPTLRVAEVSFPMARYARCEIVKVSSVLDMIRTIIKELKSIALLKEHEDNVAITYDFTSIDEAQMTKRAEALCQLRAYPTALSHRNVAK